IENNRDEALRRVGINLNRQRIVGLFCVFFAGCRLRKNGLRPSRIYIAPTKRPYPNLIDAQWVQARLGMQYRCWESSRADKESLRNPVRYIAKLQFVGKGT